LTKIKMYDLQEGGMSEARIENVVALACRACQRLPSAHGTTTCSDAFKNTRIMKKKAPLLLLCKAMPRYRAGAAICCLIRCPGSRLAIKHLPLHIYIVSLVCVGGFHTV
jgi:hypothetical protein